MAEKRVPTSLIMNFEPRSKNPLLYRKKTPANGAAFPASFRPLFRLSCL